MEILEFLSVRMLGLIIWSAGKDVRQLLSWSCMWILSSLVYLHCIFPLKIYLFIWLHWVLVLKSRIFSCSMQTLSCGMWDLFPDQGANLGPCTEGDSEPLRVWTTREVLCRILHCILFGGPEELNSPTPPQASLYYLWGFALICTLRISL